MLFARELLEPKEAAAALTAALARTGTGGADGEFGVCAEGPPTAEGKRGAYLFLYEAREDRRYTRDATGLQHLAFVVPTRRDVHDVHAHVVQAGSTVVHPPQEWPQYPPPYFALFWLDPFGIMLEAVCHHDRD